MKSLLHVDHRNIIDTIVRYLDNISYGNFRRVSKGVRAACLHSSKSRMALVLRHLITVTVSLYDDFNHFWYNPVTPWIIIHKTTCEDAEDLPLSEWDVFMTDHPPVRDMLRGYYDGTKYRP